MQCGAIRTRSVSKSVCCSCFSRSVSTKLLCTVCAQSRSEAPEIMHAVVVSANVWVGAIESCNEYKMLRSVVFNMHALAVFRCYFRYFLTHDYTLFLTRRVVNDLMTSSSTRKICYDAQKVVRYLVETNHYDTRKGNVCLLQTYRSSILTLDIRE